MLGEEGVGTERDTERDTLARSISFALNGVYGAKEPPARAWERITGRAVRSGKRTDRGRYQRIEPCDPMVGLEPQMGVPRVRSTRR